MTAGPISGPAEPPVSPTEPPAQARRGAFARLYGAQPWHLLALLLCFAVTAYAVSRLLDDLPVLVRIAVWFVGAAVVWDLLVGPLLALADAALRRAAPGGSASRRRVSPLNYVRVPALFSLLLLVVFLPLIRQRSEFVFRIKAGLSQDPYLERWLVITAVVFAVSGLLYLRALAKARRSAG